MLFHHNSGSYPRGQEVNIDTFLCPPHWNIESLSLVCDQILAFLSLISKTHAKQDLKLLIDV